MREHIYNLLSEALPAVDFETDFLFGELDSLSIVTIFAILATNKRIWQSVKIVRTASCFQISLIDTITSRRIFKRI